MAIIGFLGVGYLVGLPVLYWLRRDLQSFRPMLWTGYGNRKAWARASVASYVFGGWPVLMVAATWRRSELRVEITIERDDFRSEWDQRGSSHER